MTTTEAVQGLYDSPQLSARSGPIYNAFSYATKIDAEAIALFIATHTAVGDTVLDPFAGSGSTGVAARLCDAPTPRMIQMATDAGLTPRWGPRTAVLYELSPIAALLGEVMTSPPPFDDFVVAAQEVLEAARRRVGFAYNVEDPDGQLGELRYAIWSDVLVLPCCGETITYWDAAARRAPARLEREVTSACGAVVRIDTCDRLVDSMGRRIQRLAWVYGSTGKRMWSREPSWSDQLALDMQDVQIAPQMDTPILWGDLHRSGYHSGLSRHRDLYTDRNARVLSEIWRQIDAQPARLRDSLHLWMLSFTAAHSTKMTRVVAKKGQADFALTGSQSGVLYVSGLPVEKNVLLGLSRKIATFAEAFRLSEGSRSKVTVVNRSSTTIRLPDRSVDYVFTDPPFGDYIPYAEVNQVNEAWLGQLTDSTDEVIISRAQGKDVDRYGHLLSRVFAECSRALRIGGLATVVFHSSRADVWAKVASALDDAGLSVAASSLLHKTQVSFKQAVHHGGTRGDALFLAVNGLAPTSEQAPRTVNDDDLRDPRFAYSRYVAERLRLAQAVEYDAREFREHTDGLDHEGVA